MLKFSLLISLIYSTIAFRLAAPEKCCPKEDHTITMTGLGRTSVLPNIVRIGFTIETKEMEALNSYQKNLDISKKVQKILSHYF